LTGRPPPRGYFAEMRKVHVILTTNDEASANSGLAV
jgi:hypothetical protein